MSQHTQHTQPSLTTAAPPDAATQPGAGERVLTRRRTMAGGLLVLGGLTLAAAQVVQPHGGDEVFAVSLAEARSRWTAWGLLIMATALLQLPAVAALRASVPAGRGARLAGAGGGTTFVSLVCLFAFGNAHASLATMVGPTPVAPEVLEAFRRLDSAASMGIAGIVGLLGFHVGWPLLLAGLARAGRLSPPLAIVAAAALFLSLFGAVLGDTGEVALFVLAAGCLVAVGTTLLRPSPAAPA